MGVFSIEPGIWLSFVKTSEFQERGGLKSRKAPSVRHCTQAPSMATSHTITHNTHTRH
jgi:hypothetical protein